MEVSIHDAVTNNTVYANGGEIGCSSCSNGTIKNNFVTTTASGDIGIFINHNSTRDSNHSQLPPFTVPAGMTVTYNSVTLRNSNQRTTGFSEGSATSPGDWIVPGEYDHNTYCVPSLPWTATDWRWLSFNPYSRPYTLVSFSTWQADGQDTHGTLVAGACAP